MMTKQDIVNQLARTKTIERLCKAYHSNSPYIKDLCQDLYIDLLNKDDATIHKLYTTDTFEYYIKKMLSNNINSSTSPFYKKYEQYRKNTEELSYDV